MKCCFVQPFPGVQMVARERKIYTKLGKKKQKNNINEQTSWEFG